MVDKKLWERIQKAFKEYSRAEFNDESEDFEEYPSDGILGLAYTELGDDNEYAVQASYDLENQQYVDYIDYEEVARRDCPIDEFIKTLEEDGTWDSFIDEVQRYYYQKYESEDEE